jgi:hypothetical protein
VDTRILLEDQIHLSGQFVSIVTVDNLVQLERPCTKEDLWKILKDFAKDKSPGLDGWTVEFFLHYYELVGEDLLGMVEESRSRGEVIKDLNLTSLLLIPKVNKPLNFGDFQSISLCNLCYKIIANILANRIKPIPSRYLFGEKLGFLQRRQIMDAMGIAQECIHGIKKINLKSLILKLDLKKAYDFINWDFLRMILV